jgi:hypothetical protein
LTAQFLEVLSLEILFRAMEENSKVLAVNSKFLADFFPVAFIEEDSFEQRSVSYRHAEQYLANLDLNLAGCGYGMRVCSGRYRLDGPVLIERFAAGRSAVMFEQNVIADGIYEGAQALRLAKSTGFPEARKYPSEGFLTHVLDRLRGLEPRAKLQMEQFGEVANEMLLSAGVPSAEIFDVGRVERVKLQGRPRKAWRT